jgi:hypothetical protein
MTRYARGASVPSLIAGDQVTGLGIASGGIRQLARSAGGLHRLLQICVLMTWTAHHAQPGPGPPGHDRPNSPPA